MTSKLEQLKSMTTVVADTGDFEAIKRFHPQDATTNPSLLLKAAALPHTQDLIREARSWAQAQGGSGEHRSNGAGFEAEHEGLAVAGSFWKQNATKAVGDAA